jgi:hypothetical protein
VWKEEIEQAVEDGFVKATSSIITSSTWLSILPVQL